MVEAVILDIDGTLIDSNEAHARAFVDAAGELGFRVPTVEEVLRLIGMGGDRLIPRVFGFEQDEERGELLEKRKGDIFRDRYLPTLRPTPGARALLERLREDGYSRVVATSANAEDLHKLLDRAGVRDLIEDATSAEEVESSKPDPDVVHAALSQAGTEPSRAVMLGDTPYDVQAATRAGVPIIAVRTGGWNDEELKGALRVFDHPADLLAHYHETPFGNGRR
jgi:HAD superfamily hydrolase (TIGR01509 family)